MKVLSQIKTFTHKLINFILFQETTYGKSLWAIKYGVNGLVNLTLKLSMDKCQRRKSNFQYWTPKHYAKIAKPSWKILTFKEGKHVQLCRIWRRAKVNSQKWKYWVNFYLNVAFRMSYCSLHDLAFVLTLSRTHWYKRILVVLLLLSIDGLEIKFMNKN